MVQLILRWSARITGLLLVGLVLFFVIGYGGAPNVFRQPLATQVEIFAMVVVLAGFLVGWRWEGVGGVMAVGGCVAFLVAELAANGKPPGGALPLFAVPGILLLLSYGWQRLGLSLAARAAHP